MAGRRPKASLPGDAEVWQIDLPRPRIEAALQILANAPALDLLVAEDIAFVEVPERLPAILENKTAGLAPVIRYMEA